MSRTKTNTEEVNSKSILGSVLKDHKDEHFNFEERVNWKSSTGSLILDIATGGVHPSLWRLAGYSNSGKTPQTLEIIRNIFNDIPNSKALWVLAEGRGLSEENRARCGLTFTEDYNEWDNHTVFILETKIYELFIKTVKELVLNNPEKNIYAIVCDSIDGLTLRDDASKDITENNRVAGQAALSKKMLQNLSLGMFKYGHWMGLISQVTSEIKIDPYAKTTNRSGNFSGGNALLHGADIILNYETSFNSDFILDNPNGKLNDGKSRPVGQNVKTTLIKSTLEASKKTVVNYPIKYGRKPSGIWVEREVGDTLIMWEMVKKSGSWYSFTPEIKLEAQKDGLELVEQLHGMENLYNYLEENKEVCKYFYDKIRLLC